jgi:wyosine [tRNA(Phe)-imidazoG37] synthetase (radical SAM superfamily)
LSLGVDIVAAKTCPFDCIYCQLGPTRVRSLERRHFLEPGEVVRDIREKLVRGPKPDHITLGGSGEPTLSLDLGALITAIKAETDVPIALLSGGALFWMPEVRAESALADVVLPSLDAGDAELFELVNRPAPALSFARVLAGLEAFRRDYSGALWLEVMILAGTTDTPERLDALARATRRIAPDKVQLNTPVRPAKDARAQALSLEKLAELCQLFTPRAEVIAEFHRPDEAPVRHLRAGACAEDILDVLARRPCSTAELAMALGESLERIEALVEPLVAAGRLAYAGDMPRYLMIVP